jgi:hypothetical protein
VFSKGITGTQYRHGDVSHPKRFRFKLMIALRIPHLCNNNPNNKIYHLTDWTTEGLNQKTSVIRMPYYKGYILE